ncbi:MAG: glycerophosphodiester phosphodiesterase [Actinomycetota bacterium]|nr:glycerophosphodiester phosphodiesterase [Actinomycetota bacterium]
MAHRGASAYAPENTLEAYDLALALGATGIELDVHETKDGVLVVVHDETVSRTLRGCDSISQHIAELTWAELSELDAGSWFNETRPEQARAEYSAARVLRLDDVFRRYGNEISYFIELKHRPGTRCMERELIRLIRWHGLDRGESPAVVVGTFSRECLQKIHRLEPAVPLVQLYRSGTSSDAIRSSFEEVPSYCEGVGPCKDSVQEPLVEAADRRGLEIYTWTVNDRDEMTPLVELGVKAIVTDFPDRLDDVLAKTLRGAA